MATPAIQNSQSAEKIIKIDGKKVLWCPADEIEEADHVTAEARHEAANQPLARAIRSLKVCAAINARQSNEARSQGRVRMADYHAAIAEKCLDDAESLRRESANG
jgi:hypothetical protein